MAVVGVDEGEGEGEDEAEGMCVWTGAERERVTDSV